jgi:hypothetical protein
MDWVERAARSIEREPLRRLLKSQARSPGAARPTGKRATNRHCAARGFVRTSRRRWSGLWCTWSGDLDWRTQQMTPVARTDAAKRRHIRRAVELGEVLLLLGEQLLDAARERQAEQPGWSRTGVGECVWRAARYPHERPGRDIVLCVAELDTERPFEE